MSVMYGHALEVKNKWLSSKAKSYQFVNRPQQVTSLITSEGVTPEISGPLFQNPFKIEDLNVFDDATMRSMLNNAMYGLRVRDLATGLKEASPQLLNKFERNLSYIQRGQFLIEQQRSVSPSEITESSQNILDSLFWELTYWKTPELYEELTEGEKLHPGIFKSLQPILRDKTVLDAGAGSGRASFECLRHGAKQVFALEPSPGLLNILEEKLVRQSSAQHIMPLRGRFDNIPLENNSVDIAIACSAFTADGTQGGELGLAELERVTKKGGKIVIIWPRIEDYEWLAAHGFNYVAMPLPHEMRVKFRSLEVARRCARLFYARNTRLKRFLQERRQPAVPFSVLGFNPPHDYCWIDIQK